MRTVEAVAGDGSRMTLGFESAPFGSSISPEPPTGKPQGPSRVERHVSGGSIGWIERLEPRGEPLPPKLREPVLRMNPARPRRRHPAPRAHDPPGPRTARRDRRRRGLAHGHDGRPRRDPLRRRARRHRDQRQGVVRSRGSSSVEPFTSGMTGSGASQYTQLSGLGKRRRTRAARLPLLRRLRRGAAGRQHVPRPGGTRAISQSGWSPTTPPAA